MFDWLARIGPVAPEEMARTFNCGIGMAVVVAEDDVDSVAEALGEPAPVIGRVVAGDGPSAVHLKGFGFA